MARTSLILLLPLLALIPSIIQHLPSCGEATLRLQSACNTLTSNPNLCGSLSSQLEAVCKRLLEKSIYDISMTLRPGMTYFAKLDGLDEGHRVGR